MKKINYYISEKLKIKDYDSKNEALSLNDLCNEAYKYFKHRLYNNMKQHIYDAINNKFNSECKYLKVNENSDAYTEIYNRMINGPKNKFEIFYDIYLVPNIISIITTKISEDEYIIITNLKGETAEIYEVIK